MDARLEDDRRFGRDAPTDERMSTLSARSTATSSASSGRSSSSRRSAFPVLLVVIDLTDHVDQYLSRQISVRDIALSYLYWLPDSMFMVLPAAVLFATVFSIGAFTRHAEITAAKASGISFYRLILPIFLGALFACGLDLGARRNRPDHQPAAQPAAAGRQGAGRHQPVQLRVRRRVRPRLQGVRAAHRLRPHSRAADRAEGIRSEVSDVFAHGRTAPYDARERPATVDARERRSSHVVSDTGKTFSVTFASARDKHFTERPVEMMSKSPDPHNMRYEEITRFINAMERSGTDASLSRVERALKIAVPVTCIIIALFGAPLATSTQRGGSAYGIAVSLATTMIFLLMIQLTRAVGAKAVIPPDFAAWVPGAIFGLIGLVLLARVRT